MFKVMKRECPVFGIGPYTCEFICDTASDISTLPTSISEGTGGKSAYDNQKCASGSIANVAENGAGSKRYMLNNQNVWCPNDIGTGSSYELPIATTEILGGVMVDGTTITADENGAISAVGSELPVASTDVLGGVMVDGTSITADENGVISAVGGGGNYIIQYGIVTTDNRGLASVTFPISFKTTPIVVVSAVTNKTSGGYPYTACLDDIDKSKFMVYSFMHSSSGIYPSSGKVHWVAIGGGVN